MAYASVGRETFEVSEALPAERGKDRSMRYATSIVWFRRDLRLSDHVALARAADASDRIVCAFVLDPELLRSARVGAPIVSFFFDALAELRGALRARGSDLAIMEGDAASELRGLAKRSGATALYYNLDYEPDASSRDVRVAEGLSVDGLEVHSCVDHTYYGAHETLKADRTPYTVFTPYKRRWLERCESDPRPPVDSVSLARKLVGAGALGATLDVPEPEAYGHRRSGNFQKGGERRAKRALDAFFGNAIDTYAERRNDPAADGTSHLSPHLRAGTIGIRTCVQAALDLSRGGGTAAGASARVWLGELIWRDFFHHILANFPHVAHDPFVAAAKQLRYREPGAEWDAWCDGRTGYPIVDAAMRQLNTYGWMHNRLRMIVASFLTKDLLLDYRLGERYFEQHLADGDLASNNGGWQWSASTGTDAAPYFRVFNPILQSEKIDPDGAFIRRMLPELAKLGGKAVHAPWTLAPLEAEALGFRLGRDYPEPIVDHAAARLRAIAFFAPVLGAR
jgi:deoxyribodipyrimidine photo-lyase